MLSGLRDHILDRKNWLSVFGLVLLSLAVMTKLHFDFLEFFSIDAASAKILIDQRIANVATIISMTIATIGFLLSNLAVKEPLVYHLLFRESKMYFIIYFTLSSTFCLILISTIRDSIPEQYLYIYPRLVLAGTYLVLVIIFFIGYLFRVIIKFTNATQIQNFLKKELINEVKRNLRHTLFLQHCRNEFDVLMNSLNIKRYTFQDAFDIAVLAPIDNNLENPATIIQPKEKVIFDINTLAIKAFTSKKNMQSQHYYSELLIGEASTEYNNYIWDSAAANSVKDKKKLQNCLILTQSYPREANYNIYRQYFDDKLEELVELGKYKELESLLTVYTEIYVLKMENLIHA